MRKSSRYFDLVISFLRLRFFLSQYNDYDLAISIKELVLLVSYPVITT